MLRRVMMAANAAGAGGVTWNPLDKSSDIGLSGSDLIATMNGTNVHRAVRATLGRSSGKYYFEVLVGTNLGSKNFIGIAAAADSLNVYIGSSSVSYGYYMVDGNKYTAANTAGYGGSYTTGDVIGVAVDFDAGKIWFSKNNTFQASGDPVAGTNAAFTGVSGVKYPAISLRNFNNVVTGRFKSADFSYSPPSGFSAWE